MVALRIKELATERGISLGKFQLTTGLALSTARRYWHSSASGMAHDHGTLRQINLATLTRIAEVLEVDVAELISTKQGASHDN